MDRRSIKWIGDIKQNVKECLKHLTSTITGEAAKGKKPGISKVNLIWRGNCYYQKGNQKNGAKNENAEFRYEPFVDFRMSRT